MNEYELTKVRRQLQRSQQVIQELRGDLKFTQQKLVQVTAERDKYHAEILITRQSIENVDKAIAQKIQEIRQQERKSFTQKLEEYDKTRRDLDLEKTVSQKLTEENQAKDATIAELASKLRELARRHNQPSYVVNATDIKENKLISNTQFYRLTEKYNKLCADMENIIAENRILRRLHGVPENFGFDLEEIKIAEKQQLEDYKTQVKHLEAEVEELEAERTQLRYRLRQFNTLYSNKGERYKDFTPEQFEKLDAYAMNLKFGRVELPQIDKSKKEMEKQIIKLRGQIEILQKNQPRVIERPGREAPPATDMKKYQEEIKSMLQPFLTNIKKIADGAQQQPGSTVVNLQNINVSQQLHQLQQMQHQQSSGQFRPPVPLPAAHNDWSQIAEGLSYTYNGKIPVEMKELYGEVGAFDTFQAKYQVAALQLQNLETMKMLKDKEQVEKALTDQITTLQEQFRKCLVVQDELFLRHFTYKQEFDQKVKQLEGDRRLLNNQLDQSQKKLQIMEESYNVLLRKNPSENQSRLAELTRRLAVAEAEALQLQRKYRVLLEEQKSLQASFTLMEKKGADIEHNLRERLLASRKNEKTLALLINSFLDDNKDNVSAEEHRIIRTRLEIIQDRYSNLLLKEGELRKKLAVIEGVERTVSIKDKVIDTMQEDASDLQLELQILRSRLSAADPNYRRYEDVFGRFVEFIKTNSISLVNFFKKFDTSGDGLLSRDELASAFNALGFKATAEDVSTIFSFFDLDGSGNVNYREFLKKLRRSGITMRSKEEQGIYKLYKAIVDANFTLRKAFDAIDKDGSNNISKGEMESAMLKMGIPITADTVEFIFRAADNDMDDKITYSEFEKIFENVVAKGEVEERALFETQLSWKYAVLLKIEECAAVNKMGVLEAFNLMDKDGSKRITIDELGGMFRKAGADISRNNLIELFQMIDRDGSKWVSHQEFLELLREAHKEKQRVDRLNFVRKRAEQIRKEYAGEQREESRASEEGAYRMRMLALETKQKHFAKRHELLAKELANREQEIKDLKNALNLNEKTILRVQQDLYEEKQTSIRIQEKTKGQLSKEQSDRLKSSYHKQHIESSELKAALETYKGLYESLNNRNKSDQLRLEKVQAERNKYYDRIKEFQGRSDEHALIGQLTIELQNSKINEGIVNERYDKVVSQLRNIKEEAERSKQELMDKQSEIINTHLFLREKSNMLQRTIDTLSAKVLPTITLEKVEELALRLREVANNKSQLQQTNKKLREDNFQIQLRNDYLEMEKQSIEALEMKLRRSHPDETAQSLIDLSKKLSEYKIVELRCKRQSALLKEKEEYYMRINHSNQDAIREMQTQLSKWEMKFNERDEFWRKRLTDQVKITESIQQEQAKQKQAEKHSAMFLSKRQEQTEQDREMEKKLHEIGDMQRSKMNVSQYHQREEFGVGTTPALPAGRSSKDIDVRLVEKDRQIDQLKNRLRELNSVGRQIPQLNEFAMQHSQVMTTSQLQTDLTGSMLRNNANRFVANQKQRQQFFQEESERLAQAAQQSIQTLQRIIDDKNQQLQRKEKLIQDLKNDYLRVKEQDTLTIQQLNEQLYRQQREQYEAPAAVPVETMMMRSTNKFGKKSDEKYNEVVKELHIKDRMLNQLQDKYDCLVMEAQKKGGNSQELKKLQNKVRDLESDREVERSKHAEQETAYKHRIANLEKLSKDKDGKLAKLQKSLEEVKRDILGEKAIGDKEFENVQHGCIQLQHKITGTNVNDSQLQVHLQKALQTIRQLNTEKKHQKDQLQRLIKKSREQDDELRKLKDMGRRPASIRR